MSWHLLELSYEQFVKKNKSIADTIIDKYIVYDRVGMGAFGSVYRGMDDKTKKQVAIKVLDLVAIDREESSGKVKQIRRRLAKTQSELMMKVNSDHVMKLYDVYENKWLKIMVIEYCNGGTLSEQILRRNRIPQKEAIEVIKQIILGIAEMHKQNIIHRDLKTDNIMAHNGIYKIVDLGFAKMLPANSDIFGTVLGTIITMAPEVMRREKYGLKADIWSIGVILYEMIYGRLPYQPMKSVEMYEQIIKKDIFHNGGKIGGFKPSDEVISLLKKMLTVDHFKRLNWQELINQQIFKTKPQLPDQYRVTVNIEHLKKSNAKTTQRKQQDIIEQVEQKKSVAFGDSNAIKLQPLSEKEKQKKKEQLDKTELNIVQWAVSRHLECLKTELIYREIILPIEKSQMLDFKLRKVIQLMYLLSARCYFNMSFVKFEFEDSSNPIVVNLKKTVDILYKEVYEKFQHYCKQLKNQEDKVSSIIGDRFGKMFKSASMKEKDNFLAGFENIEFKKEEQIWYTYENYIKQQVQELKPKTLSVKARLLHYKQINEINLKDLKNKKFYDRVQEIISQGI